MFQMHDAEKVGPQYSLAGMLGAQQKSWRVLFEIANKIKPGMTETAAIEVAHQQLKASGVECLWHPVIIRFGVNTCKIYSEDSLPDVVLQKDDIFFIDLGPVYQGHEGDVGATFVTGHDPQMHHCAQTVSALFRQLQTCWREENLTGEVLYQQAEMLAKAAGYQLNLAIKGHRLGDYPHRLYGSGQLGLHTEPAAEGVWVLEIQIKHPTLPFGAFYEDVLIRS